ncbi:MAG: hypothetical protein LBR81_05065 [Prevotellaceae bacterium]|jgi:hypothetical protein|nr:hypothetical protein [Prevotellaceae bacterium]
MPYRRLPNTDKARTRALQQAIAQHEINGKPAEMVLSYKLVNEAKVYLHNFEKTLSLYKQALDTQVSSNKNYQDVVRNARLYISHFIQVLNLCVIRNEIKKEHKSFYKLDLDNYAVPDLSTEAALLKWGKNIIEGEAERARVGTTRIYNPTIANVKVHYDIFKEYKTNQKIYQKSTARYLEIVASMREAGDAIIQEIWNEIEAKFAHLPPYHRLMECKRHGVIYYYRRGEDELTPEADEEFKKEVKMDLFTTQNVSQTSHY